MSNKQPTESAQGPSEFRTHPDSTEPDFLLWNKYESPAKDRNKVKHPGLATAEPQRQHERSLKYQPRWFDTGTPFSERNRESSEPGSRDGFGGSLPYSQDKKDPPVGPPKDSPRPDGTTPIPISSEEPTLHPPAYEGNNDKLAGFFPWDEPPQKLMTEDLPHPSPTRASDQPGRFVRYPGGGGLDRAPMVRPQGKPKPTGFLPVVNLPDPERNMFKAGTDYGRGGQDPNPGVPLKRNHLDGKGAGPGGGDDNSTEYFDMDRTGKKAGFLSMDLPKENVYKANAGRTMEDYMDLDVVFPKDFDSNMNDSDRADIGPNMKHRNERNVAPDPIKADDSLVQRQGQPLLPNQKMAIAVDPKGEPGNRITIMSPLFPDTSPAIQALKSHRFENHGAIVVDGPPLWLMGLEGALHALDANSADDNAAQIMQKLTDLLSQKGLTIDYTQTPGL